MITKVSRLSKAFLYLLFISLWCRQLLYVCINFKICQVPTDSHSVMSGTSKTSKFYVKEVKDRKITLRVREWILLILPSHNIYIYIYVIYVEQLIISSGYPVDHADSSHSALYNSYHGDGRIASLILIDYSTTQYTYYAIRYTVYFLQYFKIFPLQVIPYAFSSVLKQLEAVRSLEAAGEQDKYFMDNLLFSLYFCVSKTLKPSPIFKYFLNICRGTE